MLYLRKLFKQDLRDGKQIAFPKEPSLLFFQFDFGNGESDREIKFIFNPFNSEYSQYDGTIIETRLYSAGSESRIDGELKAFLRDKLFAQVDDIVLFKRISNDKFEFSFIQQDSPVYSVYLKLFESQYHTVIANEQIKKTHQYISTQDSSYLPYLTALRTKPFMLLAGISGTGKSRIVRELAFKSCPDYLQDKDGTTPGNYCMIEVKPNWHDSSELLGYYSNIAKGYQFTKFVQFLVKAMMFPNVPFFVCMDEMNLAPVEQYFAEFLSVLETRKKAGDTIQSGVLVDAKYFKDIPNAEMGDGYICTHFFENELPKIEYNIYTNPTLVTYGLKLPANVFIIGTVNMDDTTHQFSRKVIDRAMTIEMNGEDLTKMFDGTNNLEYLPKDQEWELAQFQSKYVSADEVLQLYKDTEGNLTEDGKYLKDQLTQRLTDINYALKDTPFVVSYRVLNELIIYAGVLLDSGKSVQEAIDSAIDRIALMKILPRIEGDEDMLGLATDANNRLCKLMPLVGEESRKKLTEMNNRLKTGFTRFWP